MAPISPLVIPISGLFCAMKSHTSLEDHELQAKSGVQFGELDWAKKTTHFQRPICAETLSQQIHRISSVRNLGSITAACPAKVVEQFIGPAKSNGHHEPEMGEGRLAAIADARISSADFVNHILGLI